MSQLSDLFNYIDDWFRDLHEHQPVDQFSLNDIDKLQDEEMQLDSLAKDLELLLEDGPMICQQEPESEFYHFQIYPSDELALHDPSIVHCCTIEEAPYERERASRNMPIASPNEYSVVMTSQFGSFSDTQNEVEMGQKCDKNNTIRTPMPRDHDYLAPIKQSTKDYSRIPLRRSVDTLAYGINREVPSVLNTAILKRFARYSERIRVLSGQI